VPWGRAMCRAANGAWPTLPPLRRLRLQLLLRDCSSSTPLVRGQILVHFFSGSRDGDEWLLPCPAFGIASDSSFLDIESMGLVAALSIPRAPASVVGADAEGIGGRLGSTVGAEADPDVGAGRAVAGGADDVFPSPHAVSIATSATPIGAKRMWTMTDSLTLGWLEPATPDGSNVSASCSSEHSGIRSAANISWQPLCM